MKFKEIVDLLWPTRRIMLVDKDEEEIYRGVSCNIPQIYMEKGVLFCDIFMRQYIEEGSNGTAILYPYLTFGLDDC